MGVRIRDATVADATAIARVHLESSGEAYSPLAKEWPVPDLEDRARKWEGFLSDAQSESLRFDLVAELDNEVVAFATAGPARRSDVDADVEVYVIHVLPKHRGQAIGSRLWAAICERVRGEELLSVYVRTFAELRCRTFYEAHGGTLASKRATKFKGGDVTEVVYVWPAGASSRPVDTLGG